MVLRTYLDVQETCLPSSYSIKIKTLYLYCLDIDNLKTAEINPVSTEWIGFVWSIKYVVTITKEFTYN